jgi:hypothetical protein
VRPPTRGCPSSPLAHTPAPALLNKRAMNNHHPHHTASSPSTSSTWTSTPHSSRSHGGGGGGGGGGRWWSSWGGASSQPQTIFSQFSRTLTHTVHVVTKCYVGPFTESENFFACQAKSLTLPSASFFLFLRLSGKFGFLLASHRSLLSHDEGDFFSFSLSFVL